MVMIIIYILYILNILIIMPWELSITHDYKETTESCLQLQHSDKENVFRSWFGPLAKYIYLTLQNKFDFNPDKRSFLIEKQFAQYTLMQASFHHQRCSHVYQINQDLENQGLSEKYELAEILLFIRMTPQHPSHETLIQFGQQQIPWCDDIEAAIEQLIETKLIQRIHCETHIFYDKNPYPHDHILDLSENTLNDLAFDQPINEHQKLIRIPVL